MARALKGPISQDRSGPAQHRKRARRGWSGSRPGADTTAQLPCDPLSTSGLLPFKHERDLRIDAEVFDLVVLDCGLELFDVDGGDPVQRTGRLGDNLPCGVLPALLALAQQFDDLHYRHGFLLVWLGIE